MNLSVLVNSCDNYSHLWDGFMYFFNKRWKPDKKEIPRYFVSEKKKLKYPEFKSITPGNVSFSQAIRTSLNQINTDYVFWLQEDYFLTSDVTTVRLKHHLDTIIQNGVDLLTFQNPGNLISVSEKDTLNNGNMKRVHQNSNYTVSMQPGIWNRRFFLMCLSDYQENPWEFEKQGSRRINQHFTHKVYVNDCEQPLCPENGVMKGGQLQPEYYEMMEIMENNQ